MRGEEVGLARAEAGRIYAVLNQFFRHYLMERDAGRALGLLSDQIYSVGTGEGEIAIGKEALHQLLQLEFTQMADPIFYTMTDYVEKERASGCWDCFCNIETKVSLPEGGQLCYHMRVTAGLHQEGGGYVIDTLHASEASKYQEEGEFYPLRFVASRGSEQLSRETQCELLELISQIMPGGIVGGYMEEGFPLYVANERMLSMAGYASYEEFAEDIGGLVINSIHPEEREFVNREMSKILAPGDQYEIEYRMRRKDGSYMWVHDIGRRTVAGDGRDAIISVLIDITQQVYARASLEHEAVSDPLTGVYNRKGGRIYIAEAMERSSSYLFFVVDLDNFKQVNDYYGHKQGDLVLCAVAQLLTKLFRKTDVVCRLGGDEFAVFAPDWEDMRSIRRKIRRLRELYRERLERDWPEARSTMSVGGVHGRRSRPLPELYQLADEALYEVKRGEKGQFKLRILD